MKVILNILLAVLENDRHQSDNTPSRKEKKLYNHEKDHPIPSSAGPCLFLNDPDSAIVQQNSSYGQARPSRPHPDSDLHHHRPENVEPARGCWHIICGYRHS